ncbi:MAG: family ATPase [Solirubrobacterales bacterium]|nr:family ATPase [Solirubrobacterales bacterium]
MSDQACPYDLCDGTGFRVDESTRTAYECRCRPIVVARAQTSSLSSVIPKRYRGMSFDRPPVSGMPPTVVRPVRRFCERIDENLDGGRGLSLFGTVGTGKTTLAMIVAQAALDARRSVAIYSLPRLLAEIRTTYEEGSEHSHVDLLDRLSAVDLLHVDDVGAERTSPWVLEQLYALVNARYEAERSMVITTNILDPDKLREQIGPRTVSRLSEMCEPIPLTGTDHRLEPEARLPPPRAGTAGEARGGLA